MKRNLLLFGSTGFLGNKAVNYFLSKDYDQYYFISRSEMKENFEKSNVVKISAGDLSKEQNVESIFSKIEDEKESSYYLFNTIGGYFGGKKIWETKLEEFQGIIEMNLTTAFLVSKYFSKKIQNAQGGSICFTSASSSFRNESGKFVYGLTKNGLNYLVKSLAKEGESINLTANAVAPVIIDTPENREWVKDFSKVVSAEEICEKVDFYFNNHPKKNGEIVTLPH